MGGQGHHSSEGGTKIFKGFRPVLGDFGFWVGLWWVDLIGLGLSPGKAPPPGITPSESIIVGHWGNRSAESECCIPLHCRAATASKAPLCERANTLLAQSHAAIQNFVSLHEERCPAFVHLRVLRACRGFQRFEQADDVQPPPGAEFFCFFLQWFCGRWGSAPPIPIPSRLSRTALPRV